MPSSGKPLTLDLNIVLTNEELKSNVSKLASFIRSYEGGGWDDAKKKAAELLKSGKADSYINQVRKAVEQLEQQGEDISIPVNKRRKPSTQSVYEKNYHKLMEIAPGLEEKLLNYNGGEISGKSTRTGYMDFIIELISLDKDSFYLMLLHVERKGGKVQSNPEMEIRVELDKKKIEAISYEDVEKQINVYEDKHDREVVNRKERKAQNDYLATWLKNLKSQGHRIKWIEPDSTGIPPSEIIDKYQKKEEKEAPTEIEKPKELAKESPLEKTKEDPQLAKIISLSSGLSEPDHKELVKRFVRLVSTHENTDDDVEVMRILGHFAEKGEIHLYFLNAWEKIKQRDYDHLIALNYLRMHLLVPDLLETLKKEGGIIQLVSDRSKTVFRMQLGDDRKPSQTVIGIYQQNGKVPEPTLLIRVHSDSKTISIDLSANSFSGSRDFNAERKDPYAEGLYQAAIAFERWLKYLDLKGFKPVLVQMKKVEDQTHVVEEPDENDEHYINKDIPDFEPGKVKLTEAHEKRGVTQKIIDRINDTKEGVTLFPRSKDMIANTRNKATDKAIKAKKPGFRLSATGKFYYEGRSNRADRTKRGL